jgi:hypothetical protein
MREFDPSVASQSLAQLEIVSALWAKTLHLLVFLRIRGASPVSVK